MAELTVAVAATLDDTWARLEWAHRDLTLLTERVDDFVDGNPFEIRREVSKDGQWVTLIAENPQPVPFDVPMRLGDVVHGLHAALDYIVCALVEREGVAVTTSHAFPIFASRHLYELNSPRMLNGIPQAVKSIIKSVQPFALTEVLPDKTPEEQGKVAETLPLNRLYRLSIAEKHRALLVTTSLLLPRSVGATASESEDAKIGFAIDPARDRAYIKLPAAGRFDPHFEARVQLAGEGALADGVQHLAAALYRTVAHWIAPQFLHHGFLRLSRPRGLPPEPR